MMHSDTPANTPGVKERSGGERGAAGAQEATQHLPTLTAHRVLLAKVGGVKQVVGRLLKGGQHQDALLHLSESEPGDPQNFTLDVHREKKISEKKKEAKW